MFSYHFLLFSHMAQKRDFTKSFRTVTYKVMTAGGIIVIIGAFLAFLYYSDVCSRFSMLSPDHFHS